jgi:hypothetical protein
MFDLFICGWESLILILTHHFKNHIDYWKKNLHKREVTKVLVFWKKQFNQFYKC